jgi:DNA-binding NtrC family response regulator
MRKRCSSKTGGAALPVRVSMQESDPHQQHHVLLIDDDASLRALIRFELESIGIPVIEAEDGDRGLALINPSSTTAIILDLILPDIHGKEVLRQIRAKHPNLPVLVLTGSEEIEDAVECMKEGANDFLQKPFDKMRMVASVRNSWERGLLQSKLKDALGSVGADAILGTSESLIYAKHALRQSAASEVTVLIHGESGTGKELFAQAAHEDSPRRLGPLVKVNCGAIPKDLVESELFGHEKGAFSGAVSRRGGLFERANGGTIFLDEIGDLELGLQVKLLRVLEERCIRRVGSDETRPIDVRIVAATHRDLKKEVEEGRFREDLYYRLSVFPIHVPPLRERERDIELLATHFLARALQRHKRSDKGFSEDAIKAMTNFSWPGNVRQLQNVVERSVLLAEGNLINVEDLPDEFVLSFFDRDSAAREPRPSIMPLEQDNDRILPLGEEEERLIRRALHLLSWNVKETAQCLGIARATLYRKMRTYGIARKDGFPNQRGSSGRTGS